MIEPGTIKEKAFEAAADIRERLKTVPPAVVILGSGWDALLEGGDTAPGISFDSIPGFDEVRAPGHRGIIQMFESGESSLLVQNGRRHVYEGLSALEASFPMWVYAELGIKKAVLLSAAGGLNEAYEPGDLVILYDHIYLFGDNPLAGIPETEEKTVFIDGAGFYSPEIEELLRECIPGGLKTKRGVYVYVTGPSYETPAEIRLLKLAGGDVVGMSTAPEVIAASYLGMEVGALCCVSNSLVRGKDKGVAHDLVLEVTRRVSGGLTGFLENLAHSFYEADND